MTIRVLLKVLYFISGRVGIALAGVGAFGILDKYIFKSLLGVDNALDGDSFGVLMGALIFSVTSAVAYALVDSAEEDQPTSRQED